MNKKKGQIGIREYVALVLLMIGSKLSDDTAALLYDKMKNSAWMAPIIGGILSVIPIYLLVKVVTNYKDKNLHDVHIHLFGKYIGTILSSGIWLVGTYAIIIDTRGYADIITNIYFTKTPLAAVYSTLILVCAYSAKKGIQHISSVAWMLVLYVKIIFALSLFLALQNTQLNRIFPILGPGVKTIIKESFLKSSMFLDFIYLGLVVPLMSSTKDYKKGTWIVLCLVIIELSGSLLIYELMFDYIPISMLSYPFHEAIRYISIGDFLTNVETFFFPIWLITCFIRFSAYLYFSAILFGGIFRIKNFEKVIPALSALVFIIGMIPETPAFTTYVLRNQLLNVLSPMILFFPFLLWIVAKVKGEFKRDQTNTNM
ncbi:GerAB/ArcD/ProY family transporter [Bacillus massilinigeriensis]|uniref:GerAB/ArcD/ProY family transporter n=1 Tax=Bacillus massilionigeriensis TaxID=1805475 RepID=UPI00096B5C38|nr:endospore germination permease [Bacillus massilionigeriensis]